MGRSQTTADERGRDGSREPSGMEKVIAMMDSSLIRGNVAMRNMHFGW